MKIVGIIPARFQSSRLPGKPLIDICGKPMLWWVYQEVKKVSGIESVIAAIDNEKIAEMCDKFNIPYLMTRKDHVNHVNRLCEVVKKIKADFYVCVKDDEPLIQSKNVEKILPTDISVEPYAGYLMRELTDPAETIDPSNIKLAVLKDGSCVYMSRSPIPYPKGTIDIKYKKLMGVECFNRSALEIYEKAPMAELEKIEDIDHLRFIENNVPVFLTMVDSDSLSVDTEKDLEKVRKMIKIYKGSNHE